MDCLLCYKIFIRELEFTNDTPRSQICGLAISKLFKISTNPDVQGFLDDLNLCQSCQGRLEDVDKLLEQLEELLRKVEDVKIGIQQDLIESKIIGEAYVKNFAKQMSKSSLERLAILKAIEIESAGKKKNSVGVDTADLPPIDDQVKMEIGEVKESLVQTEHCKMDMHEELDQIMKEENEVQSSDDNDEISKLKKEIQKLTMEKEVLNSKLEIQKEDHLIAMNGIKKELEQAKGEKDLEWKRKILFIMENEFNCTICSEFFVEATVLNCGHTFCYFCIHHWIKDKPECPICRTHVTSHPRHAVVDNTIESIYSLLPEEINAKRNQVIKERKEYVEEEKRKEALRQQQEQLEQEQLARMITYADSDESQFDAAPLGDDDFLELIRQFEIERERSPERPRGRGRGTARLPPMNPGPSTSTRFRGFPNRRASRDRTFAQPPEMEPHIPSPGSSQGPSPGPANPSTRSPPSGRRIARRIRRTLNDQIQP